MKIIIDTNVLVSATLADGKPEEIISFIIASDEWEWIGSDAILQEYREVLNRPKLRLSDTIKEKWVNIVESAIAKFEVAVNVNFPRDRKDEKFLACAVVGEADFLITGDRPYVTMENSSSTGISRSGSADDASKPLSRRSNSSKT